MKTTSHDELRQAAEREAPPPRPVQPAQSRPVVLKRFFEVSTLEDGRIANVNTQREESLPEARKMAARRALKAGLDVVELFPWEELPASIKNAVVIKHVCYDECSGGERITDRAQLRLLYPNG